MCTIVSRVPTSDISAPCINSKFFVRHVCIRPCHGYRHRSSIGLSLRIGYRSHEIVSTQNTAASVSDICNDKMRCKIRKEHVIAEKLHA